MTWGASLRLFFELLRELQPEGNLFLPNCEKATSFFHDGDGRDEVLLRIFLFFLATYEKRFPFIRFEREILLGYNVR